MLVHNTCGDAGVSLPANDAGPPSVLYHYTTEEGMTGIRQSGDIWASLEESGPRHARHGDGQYLTDVEPGTLSGPELSNVLVRNFNEAARFTHYVKIYTEGIPLRRERPGVFRHVTRMPLDVYSRILSWGKN